MDGFYLVCFMTTLTLIDSTALLMLLWIASTDAASVMSNSGFTAAASMACMLV